MTDSVSSLQSSGVHDGSTERATRVRAIYGEHFDYVARTLRRLKIPARHLEDVAHDVFVVVYQRLDTYDASRPIKPWLFGIAFRVAADFGKRAANRNESLQDPPLPPISDLDVEAALDDERARRLVHHALDVLSDEQRVVFVLHELDGESVADIAETFTIPVNTAYSRLRLARRRFVERIRELRGDGEEGGHV